MPNLFNKFSTYSAIFAILLAHFAQILADSSGENSTIHYNESGVQPAAFLCADGKGPLLEGEERIFPCDGQCPAGFECETVKGMNEGGICCPNLEELYKLYNAAESSEENAGGDVGGERKEKEDGEEKSTVNVGRDEQQELGVNAMALLEEHYGEKIVRPRPKPRSVSPLSNPRPDEQSPIALVRSNPIEIRRTQQRWDGLSEGRHNAETFKHIIKTAMEDYELGDDY